MRVNPSLCDICGTCASVCQVSAIIIEEFIVKIDNSKCIKCLSCVKVCPLEAIKEETE
ncbi:MAG: 4Fe-4S binding protein [Candidatus Cloacimonetes bacterium]|jgi:Fe-S-cluster-containing hydrogenase component 2|nr:4Fe-4S binding protein [Candidatus Cloacimonadota bacterium]MDD3501626.1 4Fe-4S binding protein [Candidatus Cloacimonadota bacterium]